VHLVVIGLNHRTAPVELREKLSIGEDALPNALADLRAKSPVSECLILCTCNRTEIYACAQSKSDDERLIAWMSAFFGVDAESLSPHLYSHAGHKAAEHLFRVASGIDSMMIGEAQILGQVKDAYQIAAQNKAGGPVLNALFQQAIAVGKRVRTETEIGKGAFSVGSAAVHLAGSIFDRLTGRTVLVIGAGEMSELTMAHLASSGASPVLVANRTFSKAESLASRFGGRAVKFDGIGSAMEAADIVITSTGSSEPIVTREMISRVHHARRGRPIFFIDMAVPRDIEPRVGDLDNVFLYNIDDLQAVVAADVAGRRAEIAKVEEIIAEEVEDFLRWFRALDAVPIITSLREKLDRIREAEFEKLKGRLPDLTPEEHEAINAAMRTIVNKMCHQPMVQIKEYAAGQDAASKLEAICEVFGIRPPDEASSKGSDGES
jgi:glutamyl-tRNA reductase